MLPAVCVIFGASTRQVWTCRCALAVPTFSRLLSGGRAASRSQKCSTYARPNVHMQQCSAVLQADHQDVQECSTYAMQQPLACYVNTLVFALYSTRWAPSASPLVLLTVLVLALLGSGGRVGLGWVGLGQGPALSPTHGPRRLPCRTRLGGRTQVSGHKAYRTVDRPQTPRWRSRAGDAAVPVCMCPCVSGP